MTATIDNIKTTMTPITTVEEAQDADVSRASGMFFFVSSLTTVILRTATLATNQLIT